MQAAFKHRSYCGSQTPNLPLFLRITGSVHEGEWDRDTESSGRLRTLPTASILHTECQKPVIDAEFSKFVSRIMIEFAKFIKSQDSRFPCSVVRKIDTYPHSLQHLRRLRRSTTPCACRYRFLVVR